MQNNHKTTPWSAPHYRKIREEQRLVVTRLFNGKEQIKIVEHDLKRERNNALDTQIPYDRARKDFRRKAKNPELDKLHRAHHTYQRPNKRWAKDMAHYDVEQIDAPKPSTEMRHISSDGKGGYKEDDPWNERLPNQPPKTEKVKLLKQRDDLNRAYDAVDSAHKPEIEAKIRNVNSKINNL